MSELNPSQAANFKASSRQRTGPNKAERALMPEFAGLRIEQVIVPATREEFESAVDQISDAGQCGFDTESKPTFRAGQKSKGPHVIQFALAERAFIFQLHFPESEKFAARVMTSKEVQKVGFGLKNDHTQIRNRFGVDLNNVVDLDQVFRKRGFRGQLGVRGAIGVLFEQNFRKSKRTTTSNWASRSLTDRQLLYAANDAYAALKVMQALDEA